MPFASGQVDPLCAGKYQFDECGEDLIVAKFCQDIDTIFEEFEFGECVYYPGYPPYDLLCLDGQQGYAPRFSETCTSEQVCCPVPPTGVLIEDAACQDPEPSAICVGNLVIQQDACGVEVDEIDCAVSGEVCCPVLIGGEPTVNCIEPLPLSECEGDVLVTRDACGGSEIRTVCSVACVVISDVAQCSEGCGDTITQAGEQCDPPGPAPTQCTVPGEVCGSNCQCGQCGNGNLDLYEDCDESAGVFCPTDEACTDFCTCVQSICGNNMVEGGEVVITANHKSLRSTDL